ncbi:MAG: OmpA family protein [candidate division WOR-3 bacterium]
MKYLGWLLFLFVIICAIIWYNTKHLPLAKESERIKKENLIWQEEILHLKEKANVKHLKFYRQFYLNEIFTNDTSVNLSPVGESILRELIPTLQEFPQDNIMLAGYNCGESLEDTLRKNFKLTDQELALKRALKVGELLNSLGIRKHRIVILGVGKLESIAKDSVVNPEGQKGYLEIIIQ